MKERLIGACILVALAVIFIPMFFEGPAPGATVTKNVDLPAAATSVQTFQMSLTRNTPPEPISPRVAAGEVAADGRIERKTPVDSVTTQSAKTQTPTPSTIKTVPVALPAPQSSQSAAQQVADDSAGKPAADADKAPPPRTGWFVQAGSFANRTNAERLTRRLNDKNFNAFMASASSGGKTVYRVRVGPLEARREAEKLAPTVAAASGSPTEVVSNP